MSLYFTKLFSSLTDSTIWCEDNPTRIVWIAMLAMADRKGIVHASIPGLANRSRVSIDECEAALNRFLAPDQYSRTEDHEGRRIERIDGGWRLLNYEKYRELGNDETVRESKRKWAEKNRKKSNEVDSCRLEKTKSTQAEAEAEAEAEKKKERKKPPAADLSPIFSLWKEKLESRGIPPLSESLTKTAEKDLGVRSRNAQWMADLPDTLDAILDSEWHMGINSDFVPSAKWLASDKATELLYKFKAKSRPSNGSKHGEPEPVWVTAKRFNDQQAALNTPTIKIPEELF